MNPAFALLAFCALLSPAVAAAQALYKSVMPDGRVIYSDEPVPGARNSQRLDLAPAPSASDSGTADERRKQLLERAQQVDARMRARELQRRKAEEAVANARRLLADAERAVEAGRTPLPGEMVANVGGGVRPSQDYLDRQKALEDQVVVARERLEARQRELAELR
ncbi:MAG: DUF4124 domain-containing protein [Pseudomonadota bacterium]